MYQITINRMQSSCYQIEQQIRSLTEKIEEIENVIWILSGFAGIESIVDRLRTEKKDIEEECDLLWQMLQVLNKILLNYIKSEQQLVDEYEQNVYVLPEKELGVWKIKAIDEWII